jgi:glycosyltransferase involved in cell wall biosynthesis
MEKRKVLSIVWYNVLPAKYGGQHAIASFNQALGKQLELVCLCSSDNQPDTNLSYKLLPLLKPGKKSLFSRDTFSTIRQTIIQEQPNCIIVEHPYLAMAVQYFARLSGATVIVRSHNLEYERFKTLGKWWWQLLYIFEKRVHQKAALSVFITEHDKQKAINTFGLDPKKCVYLPPIIEPIPIGNKQAAQKAIKVKHGIPENHQLLLFAGTLDYLPNAEAVTFIYDQLAPLISKQNIPYHFIICGRNHYPSFQYLNNYHHPNVTNTGEQLSMEEYYAAADVFINPVQKGGGMQIKNLTALQHHLNIVVFEKAFDTSVYDVATNKCFVVKELNPEAFIIQIEQSLKNKMPTPETFFTTFGIATNFTNEFLPRIHE